MTEFEFIDLAKAAKLYSISRATLKEKIRNNELPARRLKRKLYVRPQDVERLLPPVKPQTDTLDMAEIGRLAYRNAFGTDRPERRSRRRATVH